MAGGGAQSQTSGGVGGGALSQKPFMESFAVSMHNFLNLIQYRDFLNFYIRNSVKHYTVFKKSLLKNELTAN